MFKISEVPAADNTQKQENKQTIETTKQTNKTIETTNVYLKLYIELKERKQDCANIDHKQLDDPLPFKINCTAFVCMNDFSSTQIELHFLNLEPCGSYGALR